MSRTYDSKGRKAQATLTRNRILACARKLFQEDGFELVTIEKLASLAVVSAPTIYALFQSKRGVLRALMDEALPPEQFQALVEAAQIEKSPTKRLAICAKIARAIYDAERAEMEIFRGAAVLSPELKELEREREMRRYSRQEDTIKAMLNEQSLSINLSTTHARDILWAFTGRDMYRMLVIERGWSSDRYEAWLSELLIRTLIGP